MPDIRANIPVLVKVHPGHLDPLEAEKRIEDLAKAPSLGGQVVLKLEFRRCTLYVDWLYWCVRKLVERFASDPENVKRIRHHLADRSR
jgi:hypothetical protein